MITINTEHRVPRPKRGSRPEHAPLGYEWLPDAYAHDVAPHGPEGRERVRQALAEREIEALLRTQLGHRIVVDPRIWDKEPVARKVYPRFKDGWIRIGLNEFSGPHVEGWVFVPIGSLRDIVTRPAQPAVPAPRAFSQSALANWYKDYVAECERTGVRPSREDDLRSAREAIGTGVSRESVRKARRLHAPASWKQSGRPKKSGR